MSNVVQRGGFSAPAPQASGPPSAAHGLDAAIAAILGEVEDPTATAELRPTRWPVSEPERRLMMDVLRGAIEDSMRQTPRMLGGRRAMRERDDARAWLRDAGAVLSVRVCCEALGIDYDAMRVALEGQWDAAHARKLHRRVSAGGGGSGRKVVACRS